MKKIIYIVLGVAVVIISIFYGLSKANQNKSISQKESLTPIRIGWQIPWATQGQLAMILKNTDILKNNNLKGDFKGFSYGGPLNEAALTRGVDVIFTADQPAATLLAKDSKWKIIGRLMYNRVSLYVPPKSPINTIDELKNKTVAMPFGAAAQRMVLKAEKDAGLDPQKDVNNINLGIYEQSDLVRDLNAKKWGEIDAMAGFDPTPAIFEEKGLIKNLKVNKVISLIVMSDEYIQKNPDAPANFLKAFIDAYDYYRNNILQADKWFVAESKLDITPRALEISASVEPNLQVKTKTEIRVNFIEDDYKIMQEAADFIFEQNLVKIKINIKDFVDLSYLNKAIE